MNNMKQKVLKIEKVTNKKYRNLKIKLNTKLYNIMRSITNMYSLQCSKSSNNKNVNSHIIASYNV